MSNGRLQSMLPVISHFVVILLLSHFILSTQRFHRMANGRLYRQHLMYMVVNY
jgi:hypothetical protein